jgi:hypothetical protein
MANKKNLGEKLNQKIHKLNWLDIKLIKWSTVAWTLFLITIWPGLANLVLSTHWIWFLIAGILLMIKPVIKYFS